MSFMRNDGGKRLSLDGFKAQADRASVAVSVESITGGTLSGCHTGGGGMIASAGLVGFDQVGAGLAQSAALQAPSRAF